MKRNLIIVLAVIAAIAIILAFNWPSDSGKTEAQASGGQSTKALKVAPVVGSIAPSFSLMDIAGEKAYAVGGKRDKALIVNFWASWCGPCDMEAPDLKTLYAKYKDKVDLYAVNETKYDTVRGAKDFVKEKELTFPVIMDKDGNVGDDYKVYSYPISFIVDKNGVVLERIEGVQSIAKWEKMLDEALAADGGA